MPWRVRGGEGRAPEMPENLPWKSWVQTARRSRERSVVVPVPTPCQLPGKSAGRISLPEHECQREKSELLGRLLAAGNAWLCTGHQPVASA